MCSWVHADVNLGARSPSENLSEELAVWMNFPHICFPFDLPVSPVVWMSTFSIRINGQNTTTGTPLDFLTWASVTLVEEDILPQGDIVIQELTG